MTFLKPAALAAAFFASDVHAHGRLLNPPHRGYMFKAGFTKVPADYNDHGLNGGGIAQTQGGKHGICGDPYADAGPRAHETGGTYGKFPELGKDAIAKCYKPGAAIPVDIQLTANHLGYFRHQLCQLTGKTSSETEECFKPLLTAGGEEKVPVSAGKNDYSFTLQLPSGVKCDGDNHCVLRWWYRGGNNAGGDSAAQEEFWNCADIWISDNCGGADPGPAPSPTPEPAPAPTPSMVPSVTPTNTPLPVPSSYKPTPTPKPSTSPGKCRTIEKSERTESLNNWCEVNCAAGNCPAALCICT